MRMIIAALLAATPALAQEPPTTLQASTTTGTGATTGSFEKAGDRDTYRIKLAATQDYAFGAMVRPGNGQFTVKSPAGAVLSNDVAGEGESSGFEFRAAIDGFFTILAEEAGETPSFPQPYTFKLQNDCRDDDRTRCRLTPGNSTSGPLSHGQDVDWIKLASLTKGRSYTATLTTAVPADLTVRTATGPVLSPGGVFTATGATMFLVIAGQEVQSAGGTYKVSLH